MLYHFLYIRRVRFYVAPYPFKMLCQMSPVVLYRSHAIKLPEVAFFGLYFHKNSVSILAIFSAHRNWPLNECVGRSAQHHADTSFEADVMSILVHTISRFFLPLPQIQRPYKGWAGSVNMYYGGLSVWSHMVEGKRSWRARYKNRNSFVIRNRLWNFTLSMLFSIKLSGIFLQKWNQWCTEFLIKRIKRK